MAESGELTPLQRINPVTPGSNSRAGNKAPAQKSDRDKKESSHKRRRKKDDDNPSHIDAYA